MWHGTHTCVCVCIYTIYIFTQHFPVLFLQIPTLTFSYSIKVFCCSWDLSACDRCGWDVGIGDQLWHCSYLKTEHKHKLAKKKSPVPQLLSFFLKHKHRQPTHQQHMGEGVLPVSSWRDIMPQCQSDVQARVIGECEKNARGKWVTVQGHTHNSTNKSTHSQVEPGFLLTAPVPYRHHPLLLASNPGIKKKRGEGWRERRSGTGEG